MLLDTADEMDAWTARVRQTLERYDEVLLRVVAGKLLRPRNHWPVEDLIERAIETLTNAPVIDRRVKELPAPARKLMTLLGRSRQCVWRGGDLLWLLACLGHAEGWGPVQMLLESGLLYPILPDAAPPLKSFDGFLNTVPPAPVRVFAHPGVILRARGEPLELPKLLPTEGTFPSRRVSDGLEYPLRIAVTWQQIAANPIRLTQAQLFFKRDLVRLQADELMKTPFADPLVEVPDGGILTMALAVQAGVVVSVDGELTKGAFRGAWQGNNAELIQDLVSGLWRVENWDPVKGYFPAEGGGLLPSVGLMLLMLLDEMPAGQWVETSQLVAPFWKSHPAWAAHLGNQPEAGETWVQNFLLGVAYPLKLVEVQPQPRDWLVTLSDLGRAILSGANLPPTGEEFPQTLIVQPNGEMILYRQGLTPPLLSRLTRFADWKTLGAACTMELNAESVYRGLEAGVTLQDILKLLQQHGTRSLPPTVMDSLQRWSNKRERITLFSSATLIEFTSTEDLEAAFQRGLVAQKLTDRIGLIDAPEPDYRAFRLLGNRDYESKSQPCVHFEADGITFAIDAALSDLVLEAELARFAEQIPGEPQAPRRFCFSRRSLRKAREQGLTRAELEQWCLERSGEPISPATALLFGPDTQTPATITPRVVIQFPTGVICDGVLQYPPTARLIDARLGSHTLAVRADAVGELSQLLRELGVALEGYSDPAAAERQI